MWTDEEDLMPDARALAVVIGPGDDPADTLEQSFATCRDRQRS